MSNTKKTDSEIRKIPARNYFIVLVVSVLVIILTLYLRAFYLNYQLSKSNVSYFAYKKVNEISTNDFDFILSESTDNILYISYKGTSELTSLDRKVYREFEKNNLLDKVIYWDVTNLKNNNEYITILKQKFPEVESSIVECPMIITIKNGTAFEVIKIDDDFIKEKQIEDIVEK